MRYVFAVFLLTALLFGISAQQARASVFCPADVAFMTPWDFTTDAPSANDESLHDMFYLRGDAPATLSGNLIVVTDTKAYTVPFTGVQILRSMSDPKDLSSDSQFLALPQRDAVRYAWVNDVTDASGKHTDCPTFPYRLRSLTADERASLTPEHPRPVKGPYSVDSLQAQFKMNLDPLTCAKPYTRVKPLGDISETYNFYDPSVSKHPKVEGRVDVDSDGNVANIELTKPSGAVSLDAYVQEWYATHKYRPATFRCIPVVSSYYFEVTYGSE